jgi:TfoX/Sxy family transcriptional regulator of competence genes
MAYDEGLAQRIRELLDEQVDVTEKKMFGGLAFLLHGHLCCGVVGDRLMVRVGPEAYGEALSLPHAHEMDFTGRPMKGLVFVEAGGIQTDESLRRWTTRGIAYTRSLPPK